ncbi:zinc finger protein 235-like [Mytilus californianus]|uniref:zinc finger protein 235-like n=1 Tax=Mytilus californianus TaxID=6549 RepID=UPI002247BC86|nr:zinc finger protein 235-like [Mytilus californianus]
MEKKPGTSAGTKRKSGNSTGIKKKLGTSTDTNKKLGTSTGKKKKLGISTDRDQKLGSSEGMEMFIYNSSKQSGSKTDLGKKELDNKNTKESNHGDNPLQSKTDTDSKRPVQTDISLDSYEYVKNIIEKLSQESKCEESDQSTAGRKGANEKGKLKKYKCEVCDKEFSSCGSMRRHMSIHSKPYKCGECVL